VEIKFLDKDLRNLYTSGKSRKHRLQPSVLQSFFEVMASLESSKDIYDLWKEPSLKFEKMKGCENRFSLRITRKFRLEVELKWENDDKTVGVVGVDKISTHYQ
jgi:toxin HigB-1